MRTLFKYLRKYYRSLFLIFILLVIQASCDLSLPTYTSNIINVGISQGGIDSSVPEVMRRSTMKMLTEMMSDEEKQIILSSYSFLNNKYELYVKKYPALANEAIYLVNGDRDARTSEILRKPILILSALQNSEMSAAFFADFSLEEFLLMPKEAKKEFISKFSLQMEKIPESFQESAVLAFIQGEYKAVGMDTDKIQTDYILRTGVKMILIALVSMCCTVSVGFIGARMAAGLAKSLRERVFSKVLSFSNTEMKKFGVASLITRSTNDVTQIQMMLVMIIRTVIYAPIIGVGALFKVLSSDASMAWIIGVALLSILSIIITLFILVLPKFSVIQKLVDKLNLVSREILNGILPIRAFGNEQHEEERFDGVNKKYMRVSLFVNRMMSFMMPLMSFIMNGVALLIVWFGAKGIDAGTLALGDMMAFIQYSMQIIMSFLMISMVSIMIPRAVVSLKRIDEVILEKPMIEDAKETKPLSSSNRGIVEFKKVAFRYPDANYDVISDISFKATPGTTTAFIGSTGSGKSTLINLIPRLFDATSGEILVDGVNIKEIPLKELHDKIGYVPQKGILFSGTIQENIKYGKPDLTDKEMKKAAEIAQATSFIEEKEEGYDSYIAQGGSNVSGGQKQRLSIARAIAKNADIYIFDDSFSALDFKTDQALRSAIKKEMKDKTILIVAQRVSTIMNAEQILVLDEGSVVGIGTHEELLENCSVYREIASSQLGKEEMKNGKGKRTKERSKQESQRKDAGSKKKTTSANSKKASGGAKKGRPKTSEGSKKTTKKA